MIPYLVSSYAYIICPAFKIKAMAKIMPRKARWAKVLPPILTILRLLVTTPSTIKTPKRSPTVAKEIPLVLLKGEIRTLEIGVGLGVKMETARGAAVG